MAKKRYTCIRCGHIFNQKCDMNNHINRKKICEAVLSDCIPKECIDEIFNHKIIHYYCVCNRGYEHEDDFQKHQDQCDKYTLEKLKIDNLKLENLKLESEIKEKELKIKKSEANLNVMNINNNITNIQNQTIQNNIVFQITPYNDPNLENFERYYLHAIARITMSVPTLIKHIHFNKNKAENHSIQINNFRTKIAKVYDGREWKTKDEDELLEELIDTYEKLLEDWADGDPEKLVHLNKYIEIKDRDGTENVHNMLKKEIKKLIYDKRDMVKSTIARIKN
jgi:hypothetical protein